MHGVEPSHVHSWLHEALRTVADLIGHDIGNHMPSGMHFVMHLVLIWGPLLLLVSVVIVVWRVVRHRRERRRLRHFDPAPAALPGLPVGVYRFILAYSRRQQLIVVAAGLIAMPVLYATLELPKAIINQAIEADVFPISVFGLEFDQIEFLLLLSVLYLVMVIVNGTLKYAINVYKGGIGERLLRRLRLTIYRQWRRGRGSAARTEVIPIVAQEVEPIGGFASDSFALPVFQGGTFVTILAFMFVQDPVLGAAAVTLIPIQVAIIPRLQRRVNRLSRRRVTEVRRLGGELGVQAGGNAPGGGVTRIAANLRQIEIIRRRIYRSKYFIKSLNNFLTSLTPFFFYSIGGYLVIEGRLTIGALVAVLAAHKDFSAPLRELFRYYQTAEDVRIRYEEMLRYLQLAEAAVEDAIIGPVALHLPRPSGLKHRITQSQILKEACT